MSPLAFLPPGEELLWQVLPPPSPVVYELRVGHIGPRLEREPRIVLPVVHLRVVLVPPEACIDLARIESLEKEAFVNLALRHLGDEKNKQRVCDEWGDNVASVTNGGKHGKSVTTGRRWGVAVGRAHEDDPLSDPIVERAL